MRAMSLTAPVAGGCPWVIVSFVRDRRQSGGGDVPGQFQMCSHSCHVDGVAHGCWCGAQSPPVARILSSNSWELRRIDMAWIVGTGLLLLLLFAFPRQMIGLLLVLLFAAGGIFLVLKQKGDRQAEERARVRSQVTVAVRYDPDLCAPSHPLAITVSNGADRTLKKVSFDLKGYRPGYSDPVLEGSWFDYSTDRIILPSQDWLTCWSAPPPRLWRCCC